MAAQTLQRRKKAVQDNNVQKALEEELEWLKRLFNLGQDAKVLWLPGKGKGLKGSVKGRIICIYENDRKAALDRLLHEFLEYLLFHYYLGPLLATRNGLMSDLAYHSKEQLIESFVKVLSKGTF